MPRYRNSQRNEDNELVYKDVCNPITKEFREELYPLILEEYENDKNRAQGRAAERTEGNKAEEKDVTGLEGQGSCECA